MTNLMEKKVFLIDIYYLVIWINGILPITWNHFFSSVSQVPSRFPLLVLVVPVISFLSSLPSNNYHLESLKISNVSIKEHSFVKCQI